MAAPASHNWATGIIFKLPFNSYEPNKKNQKKNVTKIVFDRGPYLYHGRIKALADGARAGGLQF